MARKPDYFVHAMNKETNEKSRVGAAWINDDKERASISIKLDPFIVLTANSNLVITMFLNDNPTGSKPRANIDDDIPF